MRLVLDACAVLLLLLLGALVFVFVLVPVLVSLCIRLGRRRWA